MNETEGICPCDDEHSPGWCDHLCCPAGCLNRKSTLDDLEAACKRSQIAGWWAVADYQLLQKFAPALILAVRMRLNPKALTLRN